MVENEDAFRASLFLQDFLNLFVINILNSLFVREVLLDTRVLDEVETGCVEGEIVLILLVACVVNDGGVRVSADVGFLLPLRRIIDVLEGCLLAYGSIVVEGGGNVVGDERCSGDHCFWEGESARFG